MADKYNTAARKKMASSGAAMSDGSYPIADAEDLSNAIHAVGRGGGSHDAIRAHIIKRAKSLGLSSQIPDNWGADGSMSDGDSDSGGRSWAAEPERRFTTGQIEVRSSEQGQKIGGYGAVFGKFSRNLGGFVEMVHGGAFNQARNHGWPNVVCRYNHDPNMVLGTTAGRTLSLHTDNVGLDYEVLPPQSRQDILELVQRGDVQFSSFAFRVPPGGDEWSVTEQNYPLRTLHEVQLVDVAPVLDPAYPDATAGLRSLARAMDAPFEEVRVMAEGDELRKFFVRTDNAGPPKKAKPTVFAAAAAAQLQARRFDPFIDQG